MMEDTPSPPEDYEVVIRVFKREKGGRVKSVAKTSLFFPTTKHLLDWSDNSGVDFS